MPGPRLEVRVRRLRGLRDALRPPAAPRPARPAQAARRAARGASTPLRAAGELLSNASFLLLVLYFTLPALAGWVVRDWMPAILKEQFGIGQGRAGVTATVYWQVAAIVGSLLGGWLADRWMRRTDRGRIYASAIGMGLIVPAIFGVGNAGTLAIAVGLPGPVRPRLGVLRRQQHADPRPDRPARAASDRLRDHEPGEHQLRRLGRLGLRLAPRPARAAQRHLQPVRRRGHRLDRPRPADPAAARTDPESRDLEPKLQGLIAAAHTPFPPTASWTSASSSGRPSTSCAMASAPPSSPGPPANATL